MHVHDTAPECWRPVPYPPFGDAYEVSCLGRVKRTAPHSNPRWNPGLLTPQVWGDGHVYVRMFVDGVGKTATVHKMMALAFLGPQPFPSAKARHLDDVKTNNVLDNIAWGTQRENMADMVRNGNAGRARGERSGRSVLTDAIVRQIRADHAAGVGYSQIAAKHGTSKSAVAFVIQGRTWRHVT